MLVMKVYIDAYSTLYIAKGDLDAIDTLLRNSAGLNIDCKVCRIYIYNLSFFLLLLLLFLFFERFVFIYSMCDYIYI